MDHIHYLRLANKEAKAARAAGNTPFGCVLVDKNGEILLAQGNVEITEKKCTGHAETALIEKASMLYSKDFLWDCILYSTFEPCAMCSGAMYWGNIGTIVYGLDETDLLKLTGDDRQNPTFSLPCREIFGRGQKKIKVLGPFKELEDEIIESHMGYWG